MGVNEKGTLMSDESKEKVRLLNKKLIALFLQFNGVLLYEAL
jgi:hypothetical protein